MRIKKEEKLSIRGRSYAPERKIYLFFDGGGAPVFMANIWTPEYLFYQPGKKTRIKKADLLNSRGNSPSRVPTWMAS
jgi:hypothetical protein